MLYKSTSLIAQLKMSGFEEDALTVEIQKLAKMVKCPICLEIFSHPMMLSSCSHLFCKDCLGQSLVVKDCCPVCNEEARRRQIEAAPVDIEHTITLFRNLLFKLDSTWDKGIEECDILEASLAHNEIVKKQRTSSLPRHDTKEKEGNHRKIYKKCHSCADGAVGMDKESELAAERGSWSGNGNRSESEREHEDIADQGKTIEIAHPQNILQKSVVFCRGSAVYVKDRCWVGINKPGGAAFVTRVHPGEENNDNTNDYEYDVRFVLDGRNETFIPAIFIEEAAELSSTRSSRSRATQATQPTQPTTCAGVKVEKMRASRDLTGASDYPTSLRKSRRGSSRLTNNIENDDNCNRRNSSSGSSNSRACRRSGGKRISMSSDSKENPAPEEGAQQQKRTKRVRSAEPTITAAQARVVIVTTSADEALLTKVQRFVKAFSSSSDNEQDGRIRHDSVSLESTFTSAVTHVVGREKTPGVLQQRTMKFMQAVAHGKWILSASWLTDSAQKGIMLPEESYEITGTMKSSSDSDMALAPRRARLDCAAGGGRGSLFACYCVYFNGPFPSPGPQKSQLQELVERAGGEVAWSQEELTRTSKQHKILVVSSSDALLSTRNVDDDFQYVDSYWVMNSITNYSLERVEESAKRATTACSLVHN